MTILGIIVSVLVLLIAGAYFMLRRMGKQKQGHLDALQTLLVAFEVIRTKKKKMTKEEMLTLCYSIWRSSETLGCKPQVFIIHSKHMAFLDAQLKQYRPDGYADIPAHVELKKKNFSGLEIVQKAVPSHVMSASELAEANTQHGDTDLSTVKKLMHKHQQKVMETVILYKMPAQAKMQMQKEAQKQQRTQGRNMGKPMRK